MATDIKNTGKITAKPSDAIMKVVDYMSSGGLLKKANRIL